MKDVERFEMELNRPVPGLVTAEDLEADAESFVAFASAFGVQPPSGANGGGPVNVTSASST